MEEISLEKVEERVKAEYNLKKPSESISFPQSNKKPYYKYAKPYTFESAIKSFIINKDKDVFVNKIREDPKLTKKFRFTKSGHCKMMYEPNFTENDLKNLSKKLYDSYKNGEIQLNMF